MPIDPPLPTSPINPLGRHAANEATALAARDRVTHLQIIEKLERLAANEDHQWFLDHFRKGAEQCEQKARDIDNLPPEKREAYAQRFFGLHDMLQWPAKQLAASHGIVKHIEREFGKQAEQ